MNRGRRILIITILVVIVLTGVGCGSATKVIDVPKPTQGINHNPNINVMVKRSDHWVKFVKKPVVSENFMQRIDGSTATIPVTAELYRQFYNYSDEKINNDVFHSATHQAYLNLINGKKDIIFVTEPSKEELAIAKKKGVKLEVTPFIREAFVFIVNKKNPVDSLTVDQIQKIYTGAYSNWNELGDTNGAPIYAFQREENSGSQTAMENIVMKGTKMTTPVQTAVASEMGDLVKDVADYQNFPGAIGYTYKYYLNNLYIQKDVKILNINGINPSGKNLINQTYPFTTNYYVVIRANEPVGSPARKLRNWLLTNEGQRLVEMCGYCKIH